MADENRRVDWEKVLSSEAPSQKDSVMTVATPRAARTRAVSDGALYGWLTADFFALFFFLLAWAGEDWWVARSPLFQVLGCAAYLVLLIICALFGLLFWLFAGDRSVAVWAWKTLPIGQPGEARTFLGVLSGCMLVVLFLFRVTERSNRSVRARRRWLVVLIVIFVLLLLAAVGSFVWHLTAAKEVHLVS